MATDKAASTGMMSELFGELVQVGVYKRTQGRMTRQITMISLLVAFSLGAWRLFDWMAEGASLFPYDRYVLPLVLLAVGGWFSFRIVNVPRFADFLIAVEAEMNKVSWPSKSELYRSSAVVIFVLFALTFVLLGFDLFWIVVFKFLGVLHFVR